MRTIQRAASLIGCLSLGALLAAGCGSDDDPAPGGTTASTNASLQALCRSYCGYRVSCHQATDDCQARCAKAKDEKLFRADVVAEIERCFSELKASCGGNEDDCATKAHNKLRPNYATDADFKACMAARESCKGTPNTISDDHCFSVLLLTPAGAEEFNACWKLSSCAEKEGCARTLSDRLETALAW